MGTRSRRYVIVGDGAAGVTAARQLRTGDAQANITLISDDPNPAYFRAALTNYLLGELREEQIWATTPNFYEQHSLHRLHGRVRRVDLARAEVHMSHGGPPLPYDSLLVAAGARARTLRFDGSQLRGLMTLRTLQDCRVVMELTSSSELRHAVVVGGGPLALEWALGMHVRGIHVSVLLRGTSFMTGALDAVASDLLLARLKHAGIQVILNDEIAAAVDRGDGHVGRVQTRAGLTLDCQLVALAIGVTPNTEWLAATGVALAKSGAIIVDEQMRTSLPNVFAAGDVAIFDGHPLQLWEPAQSQARVAASNMAGHRRHYAPGQHYMATRLFDLDFASLGKVEAGAGTQVLLDYPRGTGKIKYRKLLIEDGRLVGALLLGHREDRVRQGARQFKRLIDSRTDISGIQDQLLNPSFGLRAWLNSQGLVHMERSTAEAGVARAAEIRGTSVLDMSQLGSLEGKPSSNAAPLRNGFGAADLAVNELAALTPSKDVQAATMALGTQVLTQFNPRGSATEAFVPAAKPVAEPGRPATLEGAGQRWELQKPFYRIGRAQDSDVILTDAGVEQVHANIQRFGDDWYLRDLGSRSGTWVNDEQLSVPRRLSSPDRIRLGQTELVFYFAGSKSSVAQPRKAAPQGPSRPRLSVKSGRSLGLSFALVDSPTVVGRDPSSQIWLDDPALAPQHAKLEQRQGAWLATSLGPGFWHNQTGIAPGSLAWLTEGDLLHFGSVSVQFTQSAMVEAESELEEAAASRVTPGQKAGQMPAFSLPDPGAPTSQSFGALRVHAGPSRGQVFPLAERFIIGCGPQCQLAFQAAGVSEQHLELRWYQGALWARDLGTPTGTVKSGVRLGADAVPVKAGDWFTLGQDVTVIFEEAS